MGKNKNRQYQSTGSDTEAADDTGSNAQGVADIDDSHLGGPISGIIENEAPAVDAPTVTGSVMEPATVPVVDAPAAVEETTPVAPAPGSVATLQASDTHASLLDMFRHRLDEYIANMGRAVAVTPKDGAAHQLRLQRLIMEILRQDGTVFTRAWSDLLAKAHGEAQGAFNEMRIFRFFDKLKLEAAEARVFQNLLHLIIHTADPKGRGVMLKNIDLGSCTSNIPVPGAADKLISFYAP